MNENNEKKQVTTIWLLTILIIILITIIVGLIITVIKTNKEANLKVEQPLEQIRQNTLSNQLPINNTNEIAKVNKSNVNATTEVNSNNANVTTSTTNIVNDKFVETNSKVNIVGEWKVSKIVDENGSEVSLNLVFGSGISDGNRLTFKENLEYINGIGVTGEGNEGGTYTITNNTVTMLDMKQRKSELKYDSTNDTLEEDHNNDGTRIVTYVRVSEEEIEAQKTTKEKVIGNWHADKAIDKNGNNIDLSTIFSSYNTGNRPHQFRQK